MLRYTDKIIVNKQPIEPVPYYKPDGKDHSLSSEPKFKTLIECGAEIKNWELISDYNKEQAFLAKVSDRITEYETISKLKDEWNRNHKYQYFMNIMSEEEYNSRFRLIYLEKLKHQSQFVESEKKLEINITSHCDEWTGGELSWEDKRLQVISEYGW